MAGVTKKLINRVEDCVNESIQGFLAVHSGLRTLPGQPRVIVRADLDRYKASGRVTSLTGGGSGHEPAFLGYIGEGIMTGAVHGALFASPSPSTILAALRALGKNHRAGTLVILNNYTGDRLNFGIAVERAKAEGILAEIVINAEDCAVNTKDKTAGRRGLAGCVLLMKIVGHLAERGESLMHIKQITMEAAAQIATMGVCWSPCSLPGGSSLFNLGPDEMEIGLGMHGEAGIKRLKMQSARDTVEQMIRQMTNTENPAHLSLKSGDSIALLVNNLGAASDIELNIATGEAVTFLEKQLGLRVERLYAGRYVTSQEMAGISITLMLLNDLRCQCLDAETSAVSWVRPLTGSRDAAEVVSSAEAGQTSETSKASGPGPRLSQGEFDALRGAIRKACDALMENKDLLNRLDSGCGDGDCGSTLAAGAKAIGEKLGTKEWTTSHLPNVLLISIAETVEDTMGGCSGALYSLLLTSAAHQMAKESSCKSESWIRAFRCGIETISRYGGAEPGDRTMLDPLSAALAELETIKTDLDELDRWRLAVEAAEREVERTIQMTAKAGRASYVSRDQLSQPDPGAKAVAIWMRAILEAFGAKR